MRKIDIKKICLDHVEKAVFGIVLAIVLVGFVGTKWILYPKTPDQIKAKVEEGKKTLAGNQWPEQEKKKYQLTEQQAPVHVAHQRLMEKVSPVQYELSGPMVSYPWDARKPVREPQTLAPKNIIASGARVLLNVRPLAAPAQEAPKATPKTAEPVNEELVSDEFRARDRGSLPPPKASTYGTITRGRRPEEFTSIGKQIRMMMQQQQGSRGPVQPGGGGVGSDVVGTPQAELHGEGRHFVSVRAVFPLREQIMEYGEAIHKNYSVAAATFDIRDFELQRQTRRGDGSWSDWDPVDMQVASEILAKAAGFDAEVVNSMVTNSVITMPLPERISGRWKNQATHPLIEKFTLSDEEVEKEVQMQKQLLDKLAKEDKPVDQVTTVKRKGFAPFTFDPRQMATDAFGGGGGMFGNPMAAAMRNPTGLGGGRPGGPPKSILAIDDPQRQEEELAKWIGDQIDAAGELLLFRYLDFSVEPGRTYRYRVRLVLANPNYGKRISDAGGFENVVQGETRETPWSDVTEPVTVDEDIKYFLADVQKLVSRVLPSVYFDVIEWDTKLGTAVNGKFLVSIGQRIADDVKTTVIDPAKSKWEDGVLYKFDSDHFLVDVQEDLRLDDDFHEKTDDGKSVVLPQGLPGRMQLPPQSMVKSETGDLRLISEPYQQAEQEQLHAYLDQQSRYFDYLKPQSNTAGARGLDNYFDLLGVSPGSKENESTTPTQKFRNQRQRYFDR